EKDSAFRITAGMFLKMIYAVMYGDLLMTCHNKCRTYEINKGDSEKVLSKWEKRIGNMFRKNSKFFLKLEKISTDILDDFGKILLSSDKKISVGIVVEIYVKYSSLANNNLEDFLISEGCEPVVPSMLEFILYYCVNKLQDAKLYGRKTVSTPVYHMIYKIFLEKQKEIIKIMKQYGVFTPPHDFEHLVASVSRYIGLGVHMGEGWLIPAEMGALAENGTENIICTQPFGCLPNHIIAKGMSRAIKEYYPNANIIAIDYDPGATRVNQENRIKLMLANAKAIKN
ncbi:MAG: 2-hydroxyglutaryl-CoA dehydratase, partial [Oscillospiraceae bacterium]|nr:2-hydroxyglutaryl-CoA dehydratase [Oscillospiraceae bacterium]